MKSNLKSLAVASAMILGCAFSAQAAPEPAADPTGTRPTRHVEKATDLLGKEVRNDQNELLGHVRELAISLETGEIAEVLLSNPGYIGSPDTWIGVAPARLHPDGANVLRLDSTREGMKSEPRFESWEWVPFTQANQMDEVYRYHGGTAFQNLSPSDRTSWGLWQLVDEHTNTSALIAGTMRRTSSPNWAGYLGFLQRASRVLGTSVKNTAGDDVGKLDNFMIDLSGGRVAAVIVSSGTFLGITDELSPVPAQVLVYRPGYPVILTGNLKPVPFPRTNHEAKERVVVLETNKETLDKAPHFSPNRWPDFGDPVYLDSVYRAYGREPHVSLTFLNEGNAPLDVR